MACGVLIPQPGIEPVPPKWKRRVLTIGPPGKSLGKQLLLMLLAVHLVIKSMLLKNTPLFLNCRCYLLTSYKVRIHLSCSLSTYFFPHSSNIVIWLFKMHLYIYKSCIQVYTVNCRTTDCNRIIVILLYSYFFFPSLEQVLMVLRPRTGKQIFWILTYLNMSSLHSYLFDSLGIFLSKSHTKWCSLSLNKITMTRSGLVFGWWCQALITALILFVQKNDTIG